MRLIVTVFRVINAIKNFLLKAPVYLGFLLLFAFVSSQIFFKEDSDIFLMNAYIKVFKISEQTIKIKDSRAIVYPVSVYKLNPFDYDFYGKQFLINVYDPLINLDRNFRPTPGLAISYGLLDDTTWNFVLREGIKFHDGSSFDFYDVEKSFEYAINSETLGEQLSSIEKLENINSFEFNIITKYPDPLLLTKLSGVFMVSSDYLLNDEYIGTGPYVYNKKEGNIIYLSQNAASWSKIPVTKEFKIIFESDTIKRIDLLLDGKADFLAFVPQSTVELIKQYEYEVVRLPSLEVQFLLFNFNSEFFKNLNARKAVLLALDREEIFAKLGGFLTNATQYIGSGVFGYNNSLTLSAFDITASKDLISTIDSEKIITSIMPKSLDVLGNDIKAQLKKIGITLIIQYVSDNEIEEKLHEKTVDLIFMGFKSELGDASEFFETVVKKDGVNNYINYSNDKIEKLISKTAYEMDTSKRLNDLKEMMSIIINEDFIGIPLFEYEIIYAFDPIFSYMPRLDGLIYLNDIVQIK